MAKRKTMNRKRSSSRRFSDSIGLLNPDTNVVDEEQTFWWDHLQEKTFPSHSLNSVNETARQLTVNSQMDSNRSPSEWWKNLELSDSEHGASTSRRHNLSAAIIKTNILLTSTSDSEKELNLRKRKVRLKAANKRKSINNAFSRALDNTKVDISLKLQKRRVNYFALHSDSDREVLQEKSQEDEEDNNQSTTGNILKSKPSISRRRRAESTEDQNPFQDILTEDDVLSDGTTRKSVALEKALEKLQEDEEDNNLSTTGNILKSKPSISRRRRAESTEDQNPFQDILTEDDVLSGGTTRKSVALEKALEKLQEDEEDNNLSTTGNILKSKPSISRGKRAESTEDQNPFQDILTEDDVLSGGTTRKSVALEKALEKLQEDEEDNNLSTTGNILKSKPSISRRRRAESTEDQNPFQDILTEDDVLNSGTTRKSVALEKASSKRSMHRNIDASKDADDRRKSMRVSQAMPLENIETDSSNLTQNVENATLQSNANELVQNSDESDTRLAHDKYLKPKSRFMQHARKSIGRNAFADALADDNSVSFSTSDPKESGNDIHKSPLRSRSSLSPSKRSLNRSKTKSDITHENPPIRRSPILRSSLNTAKKQSLDIPAQAKDNIEENSSSSSLDDTEFRRKKSIFLKPKLRIIEKLRKSLLKNPYEKILEDDNISSKKSNVSAEGNHASFELETISKRISEVRRSLAAEESSQSKSNLTTSSNDKTYLSKKFNVSSENKSKLSENSDFMNASKSMSRKNVVETPEKEVSSSRKSTRGETLKEHTRTNATLTANSTNTNDIVTDEIINDDSDDIDVERDSSVSKSSPAKKARLTHNSSSNRSETSKSTNIEVTDNSHNDTNKEHYSSMPKRLSKSSLEKVDNVNANSEINIANISQVTSSTKISKVSANIGTQKSTILSAEMETTDDEDANPRQTIQRDSPSAKTERGNKAVNRQSAQISNRISITEDRETAGRQKSLGKSQNYHNIPIKASSKDISSNANKLNSPRKTLRKIDDFFKVKQASTAMNKQSNERAQKSQIFDTEKMEKIKTKLERIKNREMAAMKIVTTENREKLKAKHVKTIMLEQARKKKPPAKPKKVVDKAFLIDGKVYRAPNLPRPKHWVTDRLYKFLWDRMEPKYKLATRLKSEKFVQELAKLISIIERRKKYESYKTELQALMKEMARLKIISTRNDFYYFCQDFLPYGFRVKVVPMLLPGNKMNIPYDPEKLHIPLLQTE